jgi:transposase
MHLSSGECHDAPEGRKSIEAIGENHANALYLLDRAYEGDETRYLIRLTGHEPVVPPKKNRMNPWKYDEEKYKGRNVVERCFRHIKEFRKVYTRYDKLDIMFMGFVQFAFVMLWLK